MSLSFVTGMTALAGLATDTVGGVVPTCGTVTR